MNDCLLPCEEVKRVRRELASYQKGVDERLDDAKTRFAVIDMKLNWLIAILGAVGVSLLGVLLKLASGA